MAIVKETHHIDHSWDFAGAKTKYYTHGIHPYPAMMIPQVAERLIKENGQKGLTAYDPFCGSGSVLLEFMVGGLYSYGTDINPLAIEISNAKTTILDPKVIENYYGQIRNNVFHCFFDSDSKSETKCFQSFQNIEYWFKPAVIRDLTILKEAVNKTPIKEYRNFFRVCFSETVRKCSNTRNGEFKLYRIAPDKMGKHNPLPLNVFHKIVSRNIEGMKSLFYLKDKKLPKCRIMESNVTAKIPIEEKSIDLIVSSPPYGDSRTTAAYGQFSRLSLQWLDFDQEKSKKIDSSSMGGKPSYDKSPFNSNALESTISSISRKDEKRASDVLSFFNDFFKAGENISGIMKPISKICFVVGNRTVKGTTVPMDIILSDLFAEFNYKKTKTIIRHIPSKRMPRINSPSNIAGQVGNTMNEEHIIILDRK